MLAGEYAVLFGGEAVSLTVDRFLTISLTISTRSTKAWKLSSDIWSKPRLLTDHNRLPQPRPGKSTEQKADDSTGSEEHEPFVLGVQRLIDQQTIGPSDFSIKSELDPRFGFGSSSAIYLGVQLLGYLSASLGLSEPSTLNDSKVTPSISQAVVPSIVNRLDPAAPIRIDDSVRVQSISAAWQLQKEHQGTASGYDIFTQALGGSVSYRMPAALDLPISSPDARSPTSSNNTSSPNKKSTNKAWSASPNKENGPTFLHTHSVSSLINFPNVTPMDQKILQRSLGIYVGGQGAPTGPQIGSVTDWLAEGLAPRFQALMDLSANLASCVKIFFASGHDWTRLSAAVCDWRRFFASSPAYPKGLARQLEGLPECDQNWTFKTSGAGGEDALIIIAELAVPNIVDATLNSHGWTRLDLQFAGPGAFDNVRITPCG